MQPNNSTLKLWLVIGCWGMAIALIADEVGLETIQTHAQMMQPWPEPFNPPSTWTPTRLEARITRAQLRQLLQVRPQSPVAPIQQMLGEPYCTITQGDETHWLYPAEWNPSTWIVVRVQGDTYHGYDFLFHQSGDWFD